MKKTIIAGLLILGAVSFANTTQPVAGTQSITGTQIRNTVGNNFKNSTRNNMKIGKKDMNRRGNISLTQEQRIASEKNRIAIQEKRLEVKKALLEKTPDWKKIEKLNLESATLQAKNRTEMQKIRFESIKARDIQNTVKSN